MPRRSLARPSRDGDQFHYVWAARRCLHLLSPNAKLKAVAIEGASPAESSPTIKTGEDAIDVAEYYGSEAIEQATLVRYIQLKHSTFQAARPWSPSELEATVTQFAARYKELTDRYSVEGLRDKLEFCFISNRPISVAFLRAVKATAEGRLGSAGPHLAALKRCTQLEDKELAAFCGLLHLEGGHEQLWDQRDILAREVSGYLPQADAESHVLLKELVARKALTENEERPAIRRTDVLRVLKTSEAHLFPAPCRIRTVESIVPREQEPELFHAITTTEGRPIIVHANGGVGKSVWATRLKLGLSRGSHCILYDCFGAGQYRSASGYRHRHKDALVQIANELASAGLCDPLVPTPYADPPAYEKAFLHRLEQAVSSLRSKEEEALLCVVIDAADNAQMAAQEIGESRSFVRDLVRATLPKGARLIFLCRTHRVDYLRPPPQTLRLELRTFSRAETATYLRKTFSDAGEPDVDEFHRLTSQNPRLQAVSLSQNLTLSELLLTLGPNPTTVDSAIERLFTSSVDTLRDAAGVVEGYQIDRICTGLASLRPLIPLEVLAKISDVSEDAIRSFAFDLGRPLLVSGNTIQFVDEPAETWFRQHFRPTQAELSGFIAVLRPLASDSPYVAAVLPQLMLEASQLTELVELALSKRALPDGSLIEKRDIELQRIQFALKASLRVNRHADAAKLALRAGGEDSGLARQRRLIQANTDLAATFLENEALQDWVSRHSFDSTWFGSHHAYEAGLLSERPALRGDGRSRLRMAEEWLRDWSRLPDKERERDGVSVDDIIELATAHLNLDGVESCAEHLRGWRPRAVSFQVGRKLARRLVDHGRFEELDRLAVAARNNVWLILAITVELGEVQRTPPTPVVKRALRLASNRRIELRAENGWNSSGVDLDRIVALVLAASRLSVGSRPELVDLLLRHLPDAPPEGLSSRYDRRRRSMLRGYALKAALEGRRLEPADLANQQLIEALEESRYSTSQSVRDFKARVGTLVPWYRLWAQASVGEISPTEVAEAISQARAESAKAGSVAYHEDSVTTGELAQAWFAGLLAAGSPDPVQLSEFHEWMAALRQPLPIHTLTHLARVSARQSGLTEHAFDYASQAFSAGLKVREHSEVESNGYVELARAIFPASRTEAAAYFDRAVVVASRVGDENVDRWGALLDLADRAAEPDSQDATIAYRLARCAEVTYDYVARDKHFDWNGTVEAIAGICGNSSLAILSRWRDREFGHAGRLLPIALGSLVERGGLRPRLATTMLGFRAWWDVPKVLRAALEGSDSEAENEALLELALDHMKFGDQGPDAWGEIEDVLSEFGIDLPNSGALVPMRERAARASAPRGDETTGREEPEDPQADEWAAIFDDLDLSLSDDIACALQRLENSEALYGKAQFFNEAFSRISVGQEADFVNALEDVPQLGLYDLRTLFQDVPQAWRGRLAVQGAFDRLLKASCRRFCMAISRSRFYDVLPFATAAELAGVSEEDITEEVLAAVGASPEWIDADRAFSLVGLLAHKLTNKEALQALSFGLDLFDAVVEDTDGDGPWTPALGPPSDIEASLAGYIWRCLAAPEAALRWEAAHVVRALCKLSEDGVLRHLVSLAGGMPAVVFHDTGLEFYELHARQWLVIGLARAAIDHPEVVGRYSDFLVTQALGGAAPHVLIRQFAKRALLALLDAGVLASDDQLRSRLDQVNTSQRQSVESRSYDRPGERLADPDGDDRSSEDKFYFGIDFGPYWLAPLGRCFALTRQQVESEALKVIRGDWQLTTSNRWAEDERHQRAIFRDSESRHSHGSYPRSDDLAFYRSYHAMMIAAGRLLETIPEHKDPEDPDDGFCAWLGRHDLTRPDHRWLADRRDPSPLEALKVGHPGAQDNWRWSVTRQDFESILISSDGRLNLWGGWERAVTRLRESVTVRSALVSPDRAMALLRALQTASEASDYRIPTADDELQIDREGFRLQGWMWDDSPARRIDEHDPWAGAVRFPPPRPATYVTELLNLETDTEQRRWWVAGAGVEVATCQVWSDPTERDDGHSDYEDGVRFQVSGGFVTTLLHELRMALLVEVRIDRSHVGSREENDHDKYLRYVPSNTRLFILNSDGNLRSL